MKSKQPSYYKAIASQIPGCLYYKCLKGIYRWIDDACARQMRDQGFDSKNIVGHTDRDLFAKKIFSQFEDHDHEVMETEKQVIFAEDIYAPGVAGTIKQLSFKQPWLEKDGEILGIIGYTVDVSILHIGERNVPVSTRELQVISLHVSGHTLKEVAKLLYISPRTAESYYNNLKSKLGFDTRADLFDLIETNKLHEILRQYARQIRKIA